ncbi:hypothetical protein [Rufibacter latericius]|uniref:Uncharacterized protein n=1 Tax=Rufibacter latericius TaxID=2487040 RepID=A0A3M9MCR7_9BACT|nr:hypothetical protein [Rufibacter latericius]RNI22623.1 hypothetical protein EFB08_21240 [Rufibacter latericius]
MSLITLMHAFLAVVLFFGVNLLGQYTPSNLGYYQLTTFLETDEAPAFNFIIRVLTPTVFIILISALFYSIGLDKYISNIYMIGVYYVLFRTAFNIGINRSRLINWNRFILYSLSIISLNYFVYKKFIITKSNILPDFNNMANELWIIIIIFLYNFINNIQTSDRNAQKRKDKYVEVQFAVINREYSPIIRQVTDNLRLRQIALAIIIFENFNRPKLFRIVEYINHFFNRKPHSLGIMQFTTTKFISDKESVKLGTEKLLKDYLDLKIKYLAEENRLENEEYYDETYQSRLIEEFNPDITYSYEVVQLANEINFKYFNNGPIRLFNGI